MPGPYTPERVAEQAAMLANRVRKRFAHLSKRFAREGVEAFRLYDWDIPEVRAIVDWYAGHVVVAEYERTQTGPDWLPAIGVAVAGALGLDAERVHLKRRRTGPAEGPRYRPLADTGARLVVGERDLRFFVNLEDRLDTGLFPDHRDTRAWIRRVAGGTDFLNLYAYTGTFTCAAAAGGARSTLTVDRSATYLGWARDNLKLNRLDGPAHRTAAEDAREWLAEARSAGLRFTLALVDPPSFSQSRTGPAFDVNRDHPALVRDVLAVMAPGGTLFFSTNHQRFEPQLNGLPATEVAEVTDRTVPEDYRRNPHRCWRIVV